MNKKTLDYMQEVVEKLQNLDNVYEKSIPDEYIDRIREIWSDMQSEIDIETSIENDEEEMPIEEPVYGYSYDQYLREVR